MRASAKRIVSTIVLTCCICAPAITDDRKPAGTRDGSSPSTSGRQDAAVLDQPALETLIDKMGADDFRTRDQAMGAIIALGRDAVPVLETRLGVESDPEIRHRIRYVLAAVLPPDQAVLVIRAWSDSRVQPGDILTHIDHRRIRRPAELERFKRQSSRARRLRLHGPGGTRELTEFNLESLVSTCEYRAPRGEEVARALRLYVNGYAEQAHELLSRLPPSIPPAELPPHLRAVIAHTAGHETEALSLLQDELDAAEPTDPINRPWHSPSKLDRAGPLKAPFRLESILWRQVLAQQDDSGQARDRDRFVQRVLVPANRLVDAAMRAAAMWYHDLRNRLTATRGNDLTAGNMLAVTSWMLSDLSLLSECIDLIEPRSRILQFTWVRVQLKAWKTFLAGRPEDALNEVYNDAREIMKKFDPRIVLIRNPDIASQVAFFLYQMPDDPRVEEMLETVTGDATNPGYLSLTHYARWMCYAIQPSNAALITKHLAEMIPHLPEGDAAQAACRLTMLQYASDKPDIEVMQSVRGYVARSQDLSDRDAWLAACDAMRLLAGGKAVEALETLEAHRASWIARGLYQTARFRANLPSTAAGQPGIESCLLATPIGKDSREWLVLTRARKLARFDAKAGRVTSLDPPITGWYPGPLTWPWLDRDESSGRVWCYARRRVIELCPGADEPLRLNIDSQDIPAFARHVAPVFDRLAALIRGAAFDQGERSEFMRADFKVGHEYFADPDLPEVGLIEVAPADPRILHVAMRGGAHLIVERDTGRTWSSKWVAEKLGLTAPPTFFVQAVPQQAEPLLFLMSDQGLIRFDVARQALSRIPLPGHDPFPPVIPESTPYVRRDPRWIYCARLPSAAGPPAENDGRVYRILIADNSVEELDMFNEGLPAAYYEIRSRADIRREIDHRLRAAGMPALLELVADARRVVAEQYEVKP